MTHFFAGTHLYLHFFYRTNIYYTPATINIIFNSLLLWPLFSVTYYVQLFLIES